MKYWVLFFMTSLCMAQPASFNDDTDIHRYLAQAFHDRSLMAKKITVHSQPCAVQDVVELIGVSAGIDFVIDADVAGDIGKINFEQKPAGDVLNVLCGRNKPRLALIKQGTAWRIMTHASAVAYLKGMQKEEPLVYKVFHLKHMRCDEAVRTKIEDMWQRMGNHRSGSYCSVDPESKKVFLRATVPHIKNMALFLHEIDCSVPQIRIDAIVAEVDTRCEQQLGFQWSGAYNKTTPKKSYGVGTPERPFTLNLVSRAAHTASVPFVFNGTSLQHILMELRAAESESKARILLKPSVLTSHDEKAEIVIGRSVPIKTIVEDVVQGKVRNVQTVNYKDVGTMLTVRPLASPDRKMVHLDILVEDSSVLSDMNEAPVIKTIRTKNKVVLRSGQTTVIGGLMLNRGEKSKSAFPVLSRLPLIGRLFRGTDQVREDSQLLIFITPTIVA